MYLGLQIGEMISISYRVLFHIFNEAPVKVWLLRHG